MWRLQVRAVEVPARRDVSPGPDGESPSQRGGLASCAADIVGRKRPYEIPLVTERRAAFVRPVSLNTKKAPKSQKIRCYSPSGNTEPSASRLGLPPAIWVEVRQQHFLIDDTLDLEAT